MIKIFFKSIAVLFTSLVFSQNLTTNSTGSFIYNPELDHLNRNEVEVFYHIPEGNISSMPILFSFHGASRNADDYRDYWIDMANQNGFMVFAPEFSTMNYPGLGDNYLMGNVFDDGDNPEENELNAPSDWTFSVIEPLFDFIKSDISGEQETYNAWGHSGGSQFLHRFALFIQNSRLGVGVCSNAGWYTVPENEIDFPYGIALPFLPLNQNLFNFLQNSNFELDVNYEQFFQKDLIIHLGTNDIDPHSSGLRHNGVVDNQQGLNRFVRGQYFYNFSQQESDNLNMPFNWELHFVDGVGHQAQVMAYDALQFILGSSLNSNNSSATNIEIYPNPSSGTLMIDGIEDVVYVELYSQAGKLILAIRNSAKVDTSNLSSGVYFLKINSGTKLITKKLIKL